MVKDSFPGKVTRDWAVKQETTGGAGRADETADSCSHTNPFKNSEWLQGVAGGGDSEVVVAIEPGPQALAEGEASTLR